MYPNQNFGLIMCELRSQTFAELLGRLLRDLVIARLAHPYALQPAGQGHCQGVNYELLFITD